MYYIVKSPKSKYPYTYIVDFGLFYKLHLCGENGKTLAGIPLAMRQEESSFIKTLLFPIRHTIKEGEETLY